MAGNENGLQTLMTRCACACVASSIHPLSDQLVKQHDSSPCILQPCAAVLCKQARVHAPKSIAPHLMRAPPHCEPHLIASFVCGQVPSGDLPALHSGSAPTSALRRGCRVRRIVNLHPLCAHPARRLRAGQGIPCAAADKAAGPPKPNFESTECAFWKGRRSVWWSCGP